MSADNPYLTLAQELPEPAPTQSQPQPEAANQSDGNPYLPIAQADAAADRTRMSTVLDTVMPQNPDKAARAQELSKEFGLDVSTIERNQDDYDRLSRIRKVQQLTAASPILARQLTDPNFAALSHDNVANMGSIEGLFRSLAAGGSFDLLSGAYGVLETGAGMVAPLADPLAGTILPENPLRRMQAQFHDWRQIDNAWADRIAGDQTGTGALESGIRSGFRSFGQMVPGLAASVLTDNPAFALGSAAGIQGGQSAGASLDAGQSPWQAFQYGTEDAIAEALTEKLPVGKLLSDLDVGAPFWKVLGHQVITEVPSELAATAWQNFDEWANLHADQPFSAYLDTLPGDEAQTLIATLTTTVLTAGLGKGVSAAAMRAQAKANGAQQGANLLTQLSNLAKSDKVLQRDPATFQQFVADAADGSPVENVYVDANTLMQSGIADQVAAVSPSVAAQLPDAVQSGGQIAIPVAEYATKIAPTEYNQNLIDHLKIDPDGFSRAEAQTWEQTHGEELRAQVEQALGAKQGDDAFKASADAVKQSILADMNAAGRFTPTKNEADAILYSTYYAVRAAQMGETPEALYQRRRVKFAAEPMIGQTLNQDQGEAANTLRSYFTNSAQPKPVHVIRLADGTIANWSTSKTKMANTLKVEQRHGNMQGATVEKVNSSDKAFNQKVWHGSPHRGIEQEGFKLNKIGTGEGAQSFGWGVHFTSLREIAERYRVDLSQRNEQDQLIGGRAINDVYDELERQGTQEGYDKASLIERLMLHETPEEILDYARENEYAHDVVTWFEKEIVPNYQPGGQTYSAEIPEDSDLLDWDKPLREQPDKVYEALSNAADRVRNGEDDSHAGEVFLDVFSDLYEDKTLTGRDLYEKLAYALGDFVRNTYNTEENAQKASEYLNSIGIPGLRYLDGNSRNKGEGTHNYVVWDESHLNNGVQAYYQSATEQAVSKWQEALRHLNNLQVVPKLGTPAVLKELGIKLGKLAFPALRIEGVRGKHTDLPDEVITNLPAFLSDPLFAIPYKDGGYRVFIDATTAKGEPIFVGVDSDGVIQTISPLHNEGGVTGVARMNEAVTAAYNRGGKLYARNNEALVRTRASAGAPSATIALRRNSHSKARIITRQTLVNHYGAEFYQPARGSFNPESLTVSLLKGADLTTALHEGAHFFFENDIALASELMQESALVGMDGLTPGQQQLLADVSALLKWHGVQGSITEQLQQWHTMDFEEKRVYHERTAESFERYLFEGRAPSIELQPYFQRFRAWMLGVYRSLKDFLAGHPEAGKLNPDVRAVFDRMLATNEQIQLAEQGRSMMPLFTTPEQSGMTPEEFAAYHAQDVDATNDAIQDLQAKGLRDMQWLHNAHSREIKRLQKKADALRKSERIEARREVLSQPLYRAYQFLTAKIGSDDKITPPKDNTQESLFAAIAKLGGINREAATAQWGIDPKDRFSSGVFGRPVLRNEGGLSLDAMAEALAERGFLTKDANGKWDLHELEDKFFDEANGNPHYGLDYEHQPDLRPGEQLANPQALNAGRLDLTALKSILDLPPEVVNTLQARRMTAKEGLHPDLVADMFGFTSGDELVRKLAAAEPLNDMIEALTDARMLEAHGELSSPEAIARAADAAVHNEARARFIATELNTLVKALNGAKEQVGTNKQGKPVMRPVLPRAAKEFAATMIARLKIRDIRPGQYANAEARAAKAADKALKAGNTAAAVAEKRNQLIQTYATRAAYDAQDEVDKGLRYLRKFAGEIKGLDADYADQIANMLERFDLSSGQTNKGVDKRTSLAEWITAQRDAGFEPDIPAELLNEAFRTSYKNMTVEEFRGLLDTIKQIEHLGRLKHKLLTAVDQKAYEAVRDEIAASVHANAQGRAADTRTPTTDLGRVAQGLKRFWAAHIKAAIWARVMDGNKDGGPMWEYFVRSANAAGDRETTMRSEATTKLSVILAPVFKLGKMGGRGEFFPSINRSLNRESRMAIALNMGNAGNMQRLLDGEGWTLAQITPVLQTLTTQEWHAVQAIWDHFESYRPQIAAKERRIYGKEPDWVEPHPVTVTTADGQTITLRGGYYPVMYDPAASQRAEEHSDAESARRQLQGAYTTATTRRSFTKARVEEVKGRPLLYTLAGMYSGVNDVIHDLAWHEWLIDTNRLLRSQTIDAAIREHYGPEVKQQFKSWVQDVAEGEKGAANAGEMALGRLRQGISAGGLGFNVMSALMQPLGLAQSMVRVGTPWVARGVTRYVAHPLDLTREVNDKSAFMANRTRTRFRELNELRNQVQDQSAFNELVGRYSYFAMMRVQQMVDVPTWWGAYEKAIADGNDEDRAVALADQAVVDSQGGGQTKDLSAIERGGPALRLFTVFYSFMNTALNIGVAQTMGADTPRKRAKLAADYLMLYTVPAVLGYMLKQALTPGGGDDDDDWETLARNLAAAQLSYLMGLMFVVREFGNAATIVTGAQGSTDYAGPAGVRLIADSLKFGQQAEQGEFDDAFQRAAINLLGDATGLPAAQINRTVAGAKALANDDTKNPAALVFGFKKQ